MRNSLEIDELQHGYVLRIMSEEDDQYTLEECAYEQAIDVLAKAMDWLGYDSDVLDLLDEKEYALTDKGRALAERLIGKETNHVS